MIVHVVLSMLALLPAQVELRGGRTLDEPVVSVSIQGVTTTPALGGGVPRALPWDLVKSVQGEHSQESLPFLAQAEEAWRARSRLARGDLDAAEPLYGALFEKYKAIEGPTAQRVAEGWLRCCLARSDQAGALDAWVVCVSQQASDAGAPRDSFDPGPFAVPAIDPELNLAPDLAPVWATLAEARAVADRPLAARSLSVRALEQCYRVAAQLEIDPSRVEEMGAFPASGDESQPAASLQALRKGYDLLRACVEAQSPDSQIRADARQRLDAGIDADMGTWREAWRRIALGRSLLLERDAAQRSQGLFQLMHVPARFGASRPRLCLVAVAAAGAELTARGKDDASAGARLAREVGAPFPVQPPADDHNQSAALPKRAGP